MKFAILTLPFVFTVVAYAKVISIDEARSPLMAASPCVLASAIKINESQTDSRLYCIVDLPNPNGTTSCRLKFYDVKTDRFTPFAKDGSKSFAVRTTKSCFDGGFSDLLNQAMPGGGTVRSFLAKHSKVIYSGQKQFLSEYFAHDKAGFDDYNRRIPVTPAVPAKEDSGIVSASSGRGGNIVKVFYATDRKKTDGEVDDYSNDRSDSNELSVGIALVNIPADHKKGVIEKPSYLKLKFADNPEDNVTVEWIVQQTPEKFETVLKEKVAASPNHDAFVFIHGYNTTFKEGLERAGQLAFDLGFEGAPILYSWPAGDASYKYSVAEATADWTFRHLQKFLERLPQLTGAKTIHIIAHSMGNRALTNALNMMMEKNPRKLFSQIVLAAPDVDQGVFAQIADSFSKAADRVTIYASDNDQAIRLSQKYHSYKRLGQGGDSIFTTAFADTIDATNLANSGIGHSYIGDSDTVIDDLSVLLAKGLPPQSRPPLTQHKTATLPVWEFQFVPPP